MSKYTEQDWSEEEPPWNDIAELRDYLIVQGLLECDPDDRDNVAITSKGFCAMTMLAWTFAEQCDTAKELGVYFTLLPRNMPFVKAMLASLKNIAYND